MKRLITFLLITGSLFSFSQNMTKEKLESIFASTSDSINGRLGAWQFHIKEIQMISITDTNNNRMRIMSPIAEASTLNDDLIKAALIANFHTALDVKYAISDGILWSVFIHPLKELSEHQVRDALSQVYNANINFGSTFASTGLSFPFSLGEEKEEKKQQKSSLQKKKI